ncbi:helix-turn-helix domain-containing protein [Streptomyces sp. NPDC056061]|uniref:helix-turn-helix domain-containing protein n=1 Tax=Streptomyces sp. NPDC056061 TaxID=3345700 RepID=UPI0035DB3CBB
MPPARPVPSVSLRRLAGELHRLREHVRLSQEDVMERTGINRATLYRIEAGRSRPQGRTLRALLDLYGVDGSRRDEIVKLSKNTDRQDWLRPYHAELSDQYTAYISFESEALTVRNFEPMFIPGLLQTEDYAHAVIRDVWPTATATDVEQHVQARMERQNRLTGTDSLGLSVVLGEAAVRHHVGGSSVMAEQLRHLQAVATEPHIDMRVIPFDAGAHPGMLGGFSVLAFPDYPGMVYLDGLAGDLFLESESDLDRYNTVFCRLQAASLDHDDSLTLIEAALHALTPEETPA